MYSFHDPFCVDMRGETETLCGVSNGYNPVCGRLCADEQLMHSYAFDRSRDSSRYTPYIKMFNREQNDFMTEFRCYIFEMDGRENAFESVDDIDTTNIGDTLKDFVLFFEKQDYPYFNPSDLNDKSYVTWGSMKIDDLAKEQNNKYQDAYELLKGALKNSRCTLHVEYSKI